MHVHACHVDASTPRRAAVHGAADCALPCSELAPAHSARLCRFRHAMRAVPACFVHILSACTTLPAERFLQPSLPVPLASDSALNSELPVPATTPKLPDHRPPTSASTPTAMPSPPAPAFAVLTPTHVPHAQGGGRLLERVRRKAGGASGRLLPRPARPAPILQCCSDRHDRMAASQHRRDRTAVTACQPQPATDAGVAHTRCIWQHCTLAAQAAHFLYRLCHCSHCPPALPEVLDDVVGEAGEVGGANPWLTYGPPLHSSREFGLQAKL